MRHFSSFLIFLVFCSYTIAQDINQYDDQGKRHGIWEKTFEGTNIIRYQGQFKHGKEVGTFKFYKNIRGKSVLSATKVFNSENDKAEVTFLSSKGKVISEGVMDGKTYVGTWKYYQKNSNELLTIEHYNNQGELEGERLIYYPNRQVSEKQNYLNGKLDGLIVWYSKSGIVLKEMLYEKGELHGAARFFNASGQLICQGQYKRDKKDGVWKYYERGELVREKDFTYYPKYKKKTP
ncbi:toxin-antitoxin system YwqK family antitoxin [Cognatitamlana onchidii]|uniref:toxin-antitoxin system YwqK family antitoxin n=1 Tax=Cognatitamlana onchidii TaxID=2562860 RepID=UPI0010A5CA3B|nr:toxin-antitoxin system YwqK family antitoxin [Algibacter onchidii]